MIPNEAFGVKNTHSPRVFAPQGIRRYLQCYFCRWQFASFFIKFMTWYLPFSEGTKNEALTFLCRLNFKPPNGTTEFPWNPLIAGNILSYIIIFLPRFIRLKKENHIFRIVNYILPESGEYALFCDYWRGWNLCTVMLQNVIVLK